MTVRVECCGVPASGKSTLCAGALRRLEQRNRGVLGCEAMVEAGLRARDFGALGNFLGAVVPGWRRDFLGLPRALNDWHRFVVAHPAFAALCHRWLAEADADAAWREAVHHSLLTSAFEFQLAGAVDKPVLMDEGFAQRFYSLRGYRGLGRAGDAALYAAAMPRPTALVCVAAPPEACVARVQKRDHIPVLMQGEPSERLPVRFAEGNALVAELAKELERLGVPVLRVDGGGDAEAESAKIADFVERLL